MDGMSEKGNSRVSVSESLKYFISVAFLSVALPGVIYLATFLYDYHSDPVFRAVKEQEGLFVSHNLTTSYLLAAIGLTLLTIYVIIENLGRWIDGKPLQAFFHRIMKWCGYGGIFCFLATLFGAPLFSWFWHDHFESNGYSSCTGILPLRTEIFYSVWVQSPQWCEDPEVSRILREEGHGTEGVAEVNEYLEESYAEGVAGGGNEPVPPLRDSMESD